MRTPRDLPRWREQTVRALAAPTNRWHVRDTTTDPGATTRLLTHLRAAELYWVSQDMTALAMHAGGQLDTARWATADRPSSCGLIHLAGGAGSVHVGAGRYAPADGLLWGPHPDGLAILVYATRDRLTEHLGAHDMPDRTNLAAQAPLLFLGGDVLPVSTGPVPLAAADPDLRTLLGALAAAWLLMQQPQLVDRSAERSAPGVARSLARAGQPVRDITVVDLRRQYAPQDRDPDAGGDGRRYRYRWVVSGHWRDQPYGPERALRRKTWIPAYVKGPDGAPLLATERVNVWRR